jgi:hypothetical protein
MVARGLHKLLTGHLEKRSPPSLRYSSSDRGPSARVKSFDAKQYARSRSRSPPSRTPYEVLAPAYSRGGEYPGFASARSSAEMLPLFAADTHGKSFGSGNGRRLVDSSLADGQNENQKHWLGGRGTDLFSRRGNGHSLQR